MYVKDRMNKNAITVPENTAIAKALVIMREKCHRRLPVVDAMNRPVGIIDQRSIENLSGIGLMFSNTKVSDIMQTGFFKVNENALVEECSLMMKENKVGFLPVVDNTDSVTGVITSYDMLKGLMKMLGVSGEGCRVIVKGENFQSMAETLRNCSIQSIYTDGETTTAKFTTTNVDAAKHDILKNFDVIYFKEM